MFPRIMLAAVSLLAWPAAAFAQHLPPPARGSAPLMHVRLIGPAGMHVVVYQGQARPRDLAAPVQLGFRPGYIYRMEVNGFAQHPGVSLFPTLEVRGTLALPPGLSGAGFPAPVTITEDDVQKALAGVLVTKVIYLEHPERAAPAATTPDQPLETTLPPDRDLHTEAWERGRPVMILRLGQLQLTAAEVAACSVWGTVLFPGEHVLGNPTAPPMLPWACFPWYDPILGPRGPEEEWIHNGCINPPPPHYYVPTGRPQRPGLDNEGVLQGVNPEDTVAEFRDSRGHKSLTCSNRVCLFVPRFGVLRKEIGWSHYDNVVSVADQREVRSGEQIALRVPTLTTRQLAFAVAMAARSRASVYVEIVQTMVEGRVEGGPLVTSQAEQPHDVTSTPVEPPRPPERPLCLKKDVDKHTGQPGEVVTFTLTYHNGGGLPITDVAVVDSLSGRLEYIPGTSQSDRDAVFTMQPNEAGSMLLRWEVTGKLLPGESGVIRFKAKVR
jgi:uncharacterized repeat protein (TIGR01451 family)